MSERLSRSPLWRRLKEYYQAVSLRAWEVGATPHYVTNNAYLARAYAACIKAAACERGKPLAVVELGAGTGKLAFHLLRELAGFEGVSRYLITDVVQKNLDFWQGHPRLTPFFKNGRLEARLMDVEEPAEPLGEPAVILANYLFDSLPQDAFRVKDGQLQESRVMEQAPQETFASLRLEYDHRPAPLPYYEHEGWNRILESYGGCPGAFLMPVGGLRCLDGLRKLSGSETILLTADKAWTRLEDFEGKDELQPAVHGSFSFPANYHALGLAVEAEGGEVWHATRRPIDLQVSAFSFGPIGEHLRRALIREFEQFSPADFYRLQGVAYDADLSCEQALSLLHLSGYDPELLFALEAPLGQPSSERLHREVVEALDRCWENYFCLGSELERDLPFQMAALYQALEEWELALGKLESSLVLFGEQKATFHQIGLCHRGRGDLEEANRWLSRALDLDREASPMLDFFSAIFSSE